MLQLRAINDFTEYIPPLYFNKGKEVSVELKCIKSLEYQQEIRTQAGLSPEASSERHYEYIKKHVGAIKGLKVGNQLIENLDQLREHGPVSLYTWCCSTVMADEILDGLEIKN